MPTIEFLCHGDMVEKFPHPYPSSRNVPDWFKALAGTINDRETVKRCMPFLDALTAGYVIPMYTAVKFTRREQEIDVEMPTVGPQAVQTHDPSQFQGAPWPKGPALKLRTPWIVRTPPGYSTLFVPPLNRFESPLIPLAGIVDTDTHSVEINFPTISLLAPGESLKIERGEPLMQAIPFLREDWEMRVGGWDQQEYLASHAALELNRHIYAEKLWSRKSYK